MAPTISLTPSRYQAQLPAHRFRQGTETFITSPLTWLPWTACCPSAWTTPWSGKRTGA